MHFDLNVPVPCVAQPRPKKKSKGEQQQPQPSAVSFTSSEIVGIEARIDMLVHLGYEVIAFNQTVVGKLDGRTFLNVLNPLFERLRKRQGLLYLKRLTLILDEECEHGAGITNANAHLLASYDLISLLPTTAATFALACLTHSQPSALTTHIISLPLTLPRLPFVFKHSLVRTAVKNGAVFEICYVGALGGEVPPTWADARAAEAGAGAKRNWWAAAKELVRVSKGRGILVTSGANNAPDLRAPKDVSNLVAFLGMSPDAIDDAFKKTPKSVILRAQTRKTYRGVFSEPSLKIPAQAISEAQSQDPHLENKIPTEITHTATQSNSAETVGMLIAGRKRISHGQMEQSASKSDTTHGRDERLVAKKKKRKI